MTFTHAPPLTVLMVSEDRRTLRRVSTVLRAAGYRVQQVAEKQQAAALLEADPPDLLIVDAGVSPRETADLLHAAEAEKRGMRPYTLLMVEAPKREEVIAALEAGADDFLAKPIVYGELLTRLRSGARFREFERRLRQVTGHDHVTGLPGRAALWHRLRRELSADDRPAGAPAVVAVDLDFFQRTARLHGEVAGNTVLQATARILCNAAEPSGSVYNVGRDRFAVIIPDFGEEDAAVWADHIRCALAELQISLGETTVRHTASCGVSGCNQDQREADAIIRRAWEALQWAKASGRDCVARFEESVREAEAVPGLNTPVKLLGNSVARDIYTPCGSILRASDSLADASALFRRTRLQALPVVDRADQLVGLLKCDALQPPNGLDGQAARVSDVLTAGVMTFNEQTGFVDLLEHFSHNRDDVAVVVRDGKPTGLLTADNLVAPVDPVTAATFATEDSPATSKYLLVVDPGPSDKVQF